MKNQRALNLELKKAAALDPGLRRLIDDLRVEPRGRAPGFATLLQIIVSQQLSTKAAAAVWRRVEKLCRPPVTNRKILNRSVAQLRGCGLSKQKINYARDLARMVRDKTLDLDGVAALDTDAAVAELIKVRGIGQWSAEIYLMFALQNRDMFPAGDLALQVAVQRYASLPDRPDAAATAAFAARWSPHRSCVALLMWKYYGATVLE